MYKVDFYVLKVSPIVIDSQYMFPEWLHTTFVDTLEEAKFLQDKFKSYQTYAEYFEVMEK